MPDLSFKQQFTGQEAIEFATNDDGKLPMMPEPAAPPSDMGNVMGQVMGGVGKVADALSPQEELDQKFISRNKNITDQIAKTTGISSAVEGIASKIPGWGMIAAAGLKVGGALMQGSKDEFGVVEDKGKAIIGGILNPIEGISTLTQNKERKEAKERFVNTEISSNIAENKVAGNRITNSIPKYTPPSYGRFGMKLTRFTR